MFRSSFEFKFDFRTWKAQAFLLYCRSNAVESTKRKRDVGEEKEYELYVTLEHGELVITQIQPAHTDQLILGKGM